MSGITGKSITVMFSCVHPQRGTTCPFAPSLRCFFRDQRPRCRSGDLSRSPEPLQGQPTSIIVVVDATCICVSNASGDVPEFIELIHH